MFWFILIIAVVVLACFISYKKGELHELHKTRAAFEHYLEAHPASRERFEPGIEAAEHIVDQIEEEDKL